MKKLLLIAVVSCPFAASAEPIHTSVPAGQAAQAQQVQVRDRYYPQPAYYENGRPVYINTEKPRKKAPIQRRMNYDLNKEDDKKDIN